MYIRKCLRVWLTTSNATWESSQTRIETLIPDTRYIYNFEGLEGGYEMVKLCNYTIISEKLFQLIGVKSPLKVMKKLDWRGENEVIR